ncbi:manganese efflux pump MntP [Coralloluteibacterium stylophorae]|uniref:Putative manganese efflux pump MntP n=1 Tax=Coralloluteibacterium stylophorae TaxID=1776034 RepID=A0A8J7VRD4_9GAMM|nr:manganese efflux pump MntP [Coralloluteibacterium stylophorae]MBS7457954.1 manganese efflux pump MntP [Coralloluteibacterium stylophorae]
MTPVSTLLLGFAMSTDAFAAAIGKGTAMAAPRLREALRAGLIFGAIEALTPLLGWALGSVAARHARAWDHWIAFTLLAVLGARMIVAALRAEPAPAEGPRARPHSFWLLAATAVATSIDALAVGVGLAFMDVDVLVAAAVIGATTFVMVTLGMMLGRALGAVVGRRAELVGGVVLIGMGSLILVRHLGGFA